MSDVDESLAWIDREAHPLSDHDLASASRALADEWYGDKDGLVDDRAMHLLATVRTLRAELEAARADTSAARSRADATLNQLDSAVVERNHYRAECAALREKVAALEGARAQVVPCSCYGASPRKDCPACGGSGLVDLSQPAARASRPGGETA